MKTAKESGAQGDVYFFRAKRIPDGFQEKKGKAIVAGSPYGGGAHVIHGKFKFYVDDKNPLVSFAVLEGDSIELRHDRSNDMHDPWTLPGEPGAIWEFHRQRESGPDGWVMLQD